MYMYYKNDAGKIDFRFGGDYPVRITDIEGLYPIERNFNTVSYADIDGVDSVSSAIGGRTVTISGDIRLSNKQFLRDMLKVLNEPGELCMDFGEKKRKLICRSSHLTPGQRNAMYMKFVIVFYSDDPYFCDFDVETEYIRKRTDTVGTSFVLPCVFTERITENEIVVNGDVACEPVFEIHCVKAAQTQNDDCSIAVQNETYGKNIELCTFLLQDEIVEIDVENRKITSNMRGNLIKYISDNTFLHEFRLERGLNHIRVISNNNDEQVHVVCRYRCKYIEGVY